MSRENSVKTERISSSPSRRRIYDHLITCSESLSQSYRARGSTSAALKAIDLSFIFLRFGRRLTYSSYMTFCGVACLLALAMPSSDGKISP